MELQIALDRIALDRALELTAAVRPYADWIEAGTSMIKQYGAAGLADIVDAAGGTPVVADLKTVDDVAFELDLAYGAGAASATVLGLAPDATLEAAVRASGERDRELMVDLMGLTQERITTLAGRLPARVVFAAHVGKDAQRAGGKVTDLLGPWVQGRRTAVAGGLTVDDLRSLSVEGDVRVIVGSAVTKAADPVAAARELCAAVRSTATDKGSTAR